MAAYLGRRFLAGLTVMVAVSLIVFGLTFLSGDPVALMVSSDATLEEVEQIRAGMGLDQPFLVQYGRFLARAVQGDFGSSLRHQQPSLRLVAERLPATLELSLFGLCLALVGIPLGVIAAVRRQTTVDLLAMATAVFGQSIPNYWLGIMMIWTFSVVLGWFPTGGREGFASLVLPGVALATRLVALITRLARSAVLDVLREDYVRTARAKGMAERTVIYRHALRNALLPVVTVIALQFGALLGGTVIIETVFSWPGVGLLAVQAIRNRDYPVVQASVFVLALGFVVINLLVDSIYAWLDPRVRVVQPQGG